MNENNLNDERTQELLNELKEQMTKDLENANQIPFGDKKEDVDLVLNIKSKLQNSLAQWKEGVSKNSGINDDNKKLLDIFYTAKSNYIDEESIELLDKNIKALENAIQVNEQNDNSIKDSIGVLEDVLREFELSIENEKAYFRPSTIIFSKLISKL